MCHCLLVKQCGVQAAYKTLLDTLAWVAECVGARARVDGWMLLEGGSACAIHGVDVLDARGVRQPLVLKRFFRRDWVAREPDLAAREARHLEWLAERRRLRLLQRCRHGDAGFYGQPPRPRRAEVPNWYPRRFPGQHDR